MRCTYTHQNRTSHHSSYLLHAHSAVQTVLGLRETLTRDSFYLCLTYLHYLYFCTSFSHKAVNHCEKDYRLLLLNLPGGYSIHCPPHKDYFIFLSKTCLCSAHSCSCSWLAPPSWPHLSPPCRPEFKGQPGTPASQSKCRSRKDVFRWGTPLTPANQVEARSWT